MTEFKRMGIQNGRLVETQSTVVPQNRMTPECWTVQAWGFSACDSCELKDTDECGGQSIRKTGKNSKGFAVPIGH